MSGNYDHSAILAKSSHGALMRVFVLFISVLLVGCGIHNEPMTRNGYADIDVGMSSKSVEERFGRPYKIYSKGNESEIYEYIEKINIGSQVIEQRRYYIVIEKGRVLNKYIKLSNPPPFEAIYSNDPYPNY